MISQNVTEKVLVDHLVALGGAVHCGVTATAIVQDADGARVTLQSPTGGDIVKARYVVGGDGMHSIVRAAASIDFEGGTYEESFVLAEVRMQWSLGFTEVSLFLSCRSSCCCYIAGWNVPHCRNTRQCVGKTGDCGHSNPA